MSAALAPSQPALTPPPAMLMPREDQPMGALLPEHLRDSSALISNIATVSARAPLPLMTPPPAMVPEATLSLQTQAMIEAHPLSQQIKQDAMRDEAIKATVRDEAIMAAVHNAIAHLVAGHEHHLSPEHRLEIVTSVMEQAHHFRETARANPDLRIEHLENMIGPSSHLHLQHKTNIHRSHAYHQRLGQPFAQAANDPYAAQNVVLHPHHPDHPSHHLHAATAEYHGQAASVPQVGMASTGGGN